MVAMHGEMTPEQEERIRQFVKERLRSADIAHGFDHVEYVEAKSAYATTGTNCPFEFDRAKGLTYADYIVVGAGTSATVSMRIDCVAAE